MKSAVLDVKSANMTVTYDGRETQVLVRYLEPVFGVDLVTLVEIKHGRDDIMAEVGRPIRDELRRTLMKQYLEAKQ